VLAARRLIESEVAAIAAKVATDSHVDAILRAVMEMEQHHEDRTSNEQADRNFHLAIARATGNTALVGVIEYLWNQRGTLWHKLKEHFQTEDLRKQTLQDHRKVLEAIAAHDVAGARQAMRAHLERVTRTFSRG
jgi:DNA-binding FadR family transcriptional regulator